MNIKYNPYNESLWNNPWPTFQAMRKDEPIYYIEELDAWALSRFEDIWKASMDRENFTAVHGTSPEALLRDDDKPPKTFLFMDPPDHNNHRSLIGDKYTPKNVNTLEASIRETTQSILAPCLKKGELDIYQVAMEVALHTIADFIGLTIEEITKIRGYIEIFHQRNPGKAGTTKEGFQALNEAHTYILELIARYKESPPASGTHIRAWLDANIDGQKMNDEELFFSIFAMVITGSDTLPLTTAATLYYLWQNQEQLQEVKNDLSLIPKAFAEAARYDQPTNILGRTLAKDVTLFGKEMKKGQSILFLYASANRDEAEFENPDEFQIHRKQRRNLSFGTGVHFCLGQHLAKMEGKVILEEIFNAIESFEVDESSKKRIFGEFLQGICALKIRFSPQ